MAKSKKIDIENAKSKAENIVAFLFLIVFIIFSVICFIISLIPQANDWLYQNKVLQISFWVISPIVYALIFKIYLDISKINIKIERDHLENSMHCHGEWFPNVESVIRHFGSQIGSCEIYVYEKDYDVLKKTIEALKKSKYANKTIYLDSRMAKSNDVFDEELFAECNVFFAQDLLEGIIVECFDEYNCKTKTAFVRRLEKRFECVYICEENIISSLIETYINQNKNTSIRLESKFVYQVLSYFIEFNNSANSQLSSTQIGFKIASRHNFFLNMTDVIKKSCSSILCIDFFPLEKWESDNDARDYALAHKDAVAIKKERIRVFDVEKYNAMTAEAKKEYITQNKNYVNFMLGNNVEMFYIKREDLLNKGYEIKGSLIVDERCVFMAVNPDYGATYGEISFKIETVKGYIDRHNDLKSVAIEAKKFLSQMEERI